VPGTAPRPRARRQFPISGRKPDRDFVMAHVRIKRAASGQPTTRMARCTLCDAITASATGFLAGEYLKNSWSTVSSRAGTSHNMNSMRLSQLANDALGGEPVSTNHQPTITSTGQSTTTPFHRDPSRALAKLPRLLSAVQMMAWNSRVSANRSATPSRVPALICRTRAHHAGPRVQCLCFTLRRAEKRIEARAPHCARSAWAAARGTV